MRPYYLRMGVYVMADDRPDALRRSGWLSAAAITNHMVPGRVEVHDVSESDIASNRAIRRMVERYTRPAHGSAATDEERELVLQGLTAAHGDVGLATAIVHTIEVGAGYLPQSIARGLIASHPVPHDARAAA